MFAVTDDRDQHAPRTPTRPSALRVAIVGTVVAVGLYGVFAYERGLFPFDGITGERGQIRKMLIAQRKLPVETVRITGDGVAEVFLEGGEALAMRYRKTGLFADYIVETPRAEFEAFARQSVTVAGFVPTDLIQVATSPDGFGRTLEVATAGGASFLVSETADLANYQTKREVVLAPASYPTVVKMMLEKELKAPVAALEPLRDGDPTPSNRDWRLPFTERKTLHTVRAHLADGKVYIAELVSEVRTMPGQNMPALLGGEQKTTATLRLLLMPVVVNGQ